MNEIITKTIKIKTPKLPPEVDYIEKEILNSGIEPLRWAIIDVVKDELIVSVSGAVIR